MAYVTYTNNADKAQVIFSHPAVSSQLGDLVVYLRPDEIVWAYGLNTANFPTYGGEVVQILSMYFDDMTISGTTRSYQEMEDIYRWFLTYIQTATAGVKGDSPFDQRPVSFSYPHRGWQFDIIPKALPGFQYGRDVVAPTWQVVAAVAEPDGELKDIILDDASFEALTTGDVEPFGTVTAEIGYKQDNPFSAPTNDNFQSPEFKQEQGDIADFFNKLIPSYLSGEFSAIEAGSKPALAGGPTQGGKTVTSHGVGKDTTTDSTSPTTRERPKKRKTK